MVDGVLQRDKFKIIYVAPMKALAAEMTSSFGRRLAPLGLQVLFYYQFLRIDENDISKYLYYCLIGERVDW